MTDQPISSARAAWLELCRRLLLPEPELTANDLVPNDEETSEESKAGQSTERE